MCVDPSQDRRPLLDVADETFQVLCPAYPLSLGCLQRADACSGLAMALKVGLYSCPNSDSMLDNVICKGTPLIELLNSL